MFFSSMRRPGLPRWPRLGSQGARRNWRRTAALVGLLAVPLALAAPPGPPRTAQAPLPQATRAALSVPIMEGLPAYGVGGVAPIPVGYASQYPQAMAVDPVTGTVFTANSVSDTVQVISESSESVAESISVPSAPIALAVDPVSGTVYVGESGPEVQVITENASNPGQDSVTATVSAGANEAFCQPDGIGVLPGAAADTGTVYVASACGFVSVVSEATDTVTNVISIPAMPAGTSNYAAPAGVAVDPYSGNVFVADADDGYVTVINGASDLGSIPLQAGNPGPLAGLLAIAADPATGTVYVTAPLVGPSPNQGELFVIQENASNPAASAVAATIPVPPAGTSGATSGFPDAVAVNPNTATVYVTNEEGALEVMNEDTANPAADAFSYAIDLGGGNGVPVDYGAATDTSTGNASSGDVYVASDQTGDLYPILSQAISFTAPTCASPGCEVGHTSTLTAAGGGSGNPVVFSVPSPASSVCSVSGTNGTTLSYLTTGTCVVDASQANSDFYLAAQQVSQSITVLPSKTQAIKWAVGQQPSTTDWGPDTGYYGATVTLKATATSGLPVVFTADPSSTPAGACDVSGTNGTTLTYQALGTCVIDANQAGNSTYLPAAQVQVSIAVDPAPQTITFKPPATQLAGKTLTLTATGGGSGNPVLFALDSTTQPGVCSLSGQDAATVTFNVPGGCVIDANQAGSSGSPYDYMPAQPVTALITVGIAPTFVQASPPLSVAPGTMYSYTFVASGIDTPTYALSSSAPSWLSINPATGQVSGTVPANTSPPPAYTYSVTATNHFGTATTSRFVVLPAPPSATAATAQVSANLSCTATSCVLQVTNSGPAATQVVVSVVQSPQLYVVMDGQPCPDDWGCFPEANTLTWSLGSMAANSSTTIDLGLGIAGTCTISGCPPIEVAVDTPSLDNLGNGYTSYAVN